MSKTEIREALPTDLPELLRVYAAAREAMRQSGNPTQWGKDRPTRETLEEDIRRGRLFVLAEGEQVAAAFAFFPGPEPLYKEIKGRWLNEEPYGVIHRIASDGSQRGVLGRCIAWCWERIANLRIDTHRDNHIMQKLLEKNGFVLCGEVLADNGTPRLAYHKVI